MRKLILILTCIMIAWPSTLLASDWSSLYRNATNRNSMIDQPALPFTQVGTVANQFITPLVAGDILVVAQNDLLGNKIVGYRLSTLEKLWEYRLGSIVPRQIVIDRGTIYFGAATVPRLYAINLTSGQLRWQTTLAGEMQGIRWAPTIIDEAVYVSAKQLHKVDTAGVEVWVRNFDVKAPIATDGKLLFARLHNLLTSAITTDGTTAWSAVINSTDGTAPVVAGPTIYVGGYQKLYAFEKANGKKRWEYNTELTGPLLGNLASVGPYILLGTNAGSITALNDSGHVVWTNRFNTASNNGNGWQPTFLAAGDYVLAQANQSSQLRLDINTGLIVDRGNWVPNEGIIRLVADQRIIATSSSQAIIFSAASWSVGSLGDPPSEKVIHPVIIVPGTMGSWPVSGVWKIDPILHLFDPMLDGFRTAGYVDNQTLFTFPYDWHASNGKTAELLAQKIAAVRQQTGATKVDIVAHSMGSLVVRSHLASQLYGQDIDQFIAIGPPYHGSVKSYLTYEAGETGNTKVDTLKEKLLAYEARKAGFGADVVAYVQQKVPSVGELLPVTDYLSTGTGALLPYLPCASITYPCNYFLEQLNTKLDDFIKQTTTLTITGRVEPERTIDHLVVSPSTQANLWQHGMPLNYPSEQGLIKGPGDGTVTASSSHYDGVEKKVYNSEHSALLTDAAADVVKELSDKTVAITPRPSTLRYLLVRLFSPISLWLTDQAGHQIGTNPATGETVNSFPNAFYTRESNGQEYMIIPDPEIDPTAYRLTLTGNGSGQFEAIGTLLTDEATKEVTVVGQAAPQQKAEYQLTLAPPEIAITPLPSPTPSPCVSAPPLIIGPP